MTHEPTNSSNARSANNSARTDGNSGRTHASDSFSRHRFLWLFGILLSFFLIVPFTQELREEFNQQIPPIAELSAFVIILAAVVVSISRRGSFKLVAAGVGLPAAALWMLPVTAISDEIRIARYVLAILFLVYAIISVLYFIFATRRVTLNLLCASLCVYLLMGVAWALVYSLMSIMNVDAFAYSIAGEAGHWELGLDSGKSAEALYFSYATLTTLGYGDIVPTSHSARMATVLQAIVAQLYLAVLVARLVGLHIVDSQTEASSKSTH